MITVKNQKALEYLKKIHDHCMKNKFDIDMLQAYPVFIQKKWVWIEVASPVWIEDTYKKVTKTVEVDWEKVEKMVHEPKKLSDHPECMMATYHDYLTFISSKWIWLPE